MLRREGDSRRGSPEAEATSRGVSQGELAIYRYNGLYSHALLIIDGRELREHKIRVLSSSRAAQLLNKDPRGFGAAVKQLYLSGQAGGAGMRASCSPTLPESMETDQPGFNLGRPAASASGSATPTFGGGARDAAG